MPPNGQFKHTIVWAISTTRPPSNGPDAFLTQHVDQGSFTIDLAKPYTSSDPLGNTPTSRPGGTGPVYHPPGATNTFGGSDLPAFQLPSLLPYQRLLVIHAVLCSIGFLLVLPVGALVARWLRTFNRHWFKAHWITQVALGGPIIVAGWGTAIAAVVEKNGAHFDDTHKVGDETSLRAYLNCDTDLIGPLPSLDFNRSLVWSFLAYTYSKSFSVSTFTCSSQNRGPTPFRSPPSLVATPSPPSCKCSSPQAARSRITCTRSLVLR